MLELRQLRLLRVVADTGSMTQAAAELAFTPSAVSQQVAALERKLGVALLVRHARGVRLTEVGRLLLERGATIEDQLRQLEEDVADVARLRGGRLRLACFSSAAGPLMSVAIAAFRRRHPDVLMTLEVLDPGSGVAAARSGSADLVLVFDYAAGPALDLTGLDAIGLLDDPMYVALPADHPRTAGAGLAGDGAIRIGDLRDARWVRDSSPDPTCREHLDRLCREAGFRPEVAFESDNYLAVGRLVAAGVGVALVPGLAAEQMPDGVVLRRTEPATERRVTVLRSDGAAPAADPMIDILTETAAGVADEVARRASSSPASASSTVTGGSARRRRATPAARRTA